MEFDVIVVGAGGSGLAAACAASELGGKVLVLEKQHQPGGTTGIAVGSFTAAETSLQRESEIEDHCQDHIEDVAGFADPDVEAKNNSELRAQFLKEAATSFEWLRELGLAFVGPAPEPPNRVPRMHNVVPGAKAYIATLQLKLQELGAKLICDAAVQELLQDEGGRVLGVVAKVNGQSVEYRARRGVILAAGDYANDPELIGRYKGPEFQAIEGINPFAGGDGQRLVESAGGELLNMDVAYGPELRFVATSRRPFQQWLPASGWSARVMGWVAPRLPNWITRKIIKRLLVTWQHPENALFDDGAILLNQKGERFVDETSWPQREIGVAQQPDKIAYLLLDGRLVSKYSAWPHFISTAPDIAYAYVKDYQHLRSDITYTGLTLEDVVLRSGLDGDSVQRTVDEHNRFCRGEQPDPLGRAEATPPLEESPWVLMGPVKAYFTTTEGGARINAQLQVCGADGTPVPGLFAAGQNGLGGQILFGHGLHIAWAITSGRLAGKAVMGVEG